jgi:KipI family sensor histidine kinase inhibitor
LLGFSPGFPYLVGLDPRLRTPRRANPRPHVPAGSVALGGCHTGIFSIDSPGGWNLLGTTATRIFDPERREPDDSAMFLLRPGDRVKFLPVE